MRTIKIDPDFGDAWAFFYRFELSHGNEVGLCSEKYEGCWGESDRSLKGTGNQRLMALLFRSIC